MIAGANRAILFTLACLIAGVVGSSLAGHTAAAEEASADAATKASPPQVSFVSEGPLTVEETKLRDEGGRLTVRLHNDLGRPQEVRLWLFGKGEYEAGRIDELFPEGETAEMAPPGAVVELGLSLVAEGEAPDDLEGKLEGTLAVAGEGGGLVRRSLTVVLASPETASEKQEREAREAEEASVSPADNAIAPAHAVDVTITAVNYLPSLLSDTTSFLFLLTLALGALAFALLLLLRIDRGAFALLCFVAAVPLALGIAIAAWGVPWEDPSAHAISPQPIPVAAKPGDVGAVASDDGKVATLYVERAELLPRGLDSAAAYEGTYDLTPGVEKGDAKATVAVRDFWPYALLTVLAGILVGFCLRLWFRAWRPKLKLTARLQDLNEDYSRNSARYEEQDRGRPYRDFSIDRQIECRVKEIRSLVGDDLALAEKAVEQLKSYIDKFFDLREALESLDNTAREVEAAADKRGVPGAPAVPVPAGRADELLAEQVDSPEIDREAAKLGKALEGVEGATETADGAAAALGQILEYAETAERALRAPGDDETKSKLKAVLAKLDARWLNVLDSADSEAVATARKGVTEASSELAEILSASDPASLAALRRKPVTLKPRRSRAREDPAAAELAGLGVLGAEPAVAPAGAAAAAGPGEVKVTATIAWRASGEAELGTKKVHAADRVSFRIVLEAARGPLPFPAVDIFFGDGKTTTRMLPEKEGGPVEVFVSHRYAEGTTTTVAVSAHGATETLRTELIEVDSTPRSELLRRKLEQSDSVVAAASLVLALGSGMTALYFASPSWGTPVDYLNAALWGGVTAEGVALAAAIADRTLLKAPS